MSISPVGSLSNRPYKETEGVFYPFVWIAEKIQSIASAILDAVLPRNLVTEKREFHLIPLSVKKQWEKIMSEINYDRVCPRWRISGNKGLCKRVDRIGKKLVAGFDKKDWDFEFRVLEDDRALNAACLPRGKIWITTKLIEKLNDTKITDADCRNVNLDQKIAAVLSHEIIHARARHSANTLQFIAVLTLIVYLATVLFDFIKTLETVPLESLIKVSIGHSFLMLSIVATIWSVWEFFRPIELIICGHMRSHETEADIYGMRLLKSSGFRPEAMIAVQTIFTKLMPRVNNFVARGLEFYDFHPPSEERIVTCREELKRMQQQTS